MLANFGVFRQSRTCCFTLVSVLVLIILSAVSLSLYLTNRFKSLYHFCKKPMSLFPQTIPVNVLCIKLRHFFSEKNFQVAAYFFVHQLLIFFASLAYPTAKDKPMRLSLIYSSALCIVNQQNP